jgi:deoxyribose-phosphate aldolase
MRRTVGDLVGVKAAGGVRTLDSMLAILAAGACRVGATATATIGKEWRERGVEAVAEAVAVEFERARPTSP